ncbi:hypothetical protein GCM10010320_80710 [Streptomyces caelestis]|nr:hypothetical protein GCM10010320_80710 [Streptomyces caelestis]
MAHRALQLGVRPDRDRRDRILTGRIQGDAPPASEQRSKEAAGPGPAPAPDATKVHGTRVHDLKDIDVTVPLGKLVAIAWRRWSGSLCRARLTCRSWLRGPRRRPG